MSDLYDTDIVTWSAQQAALLRRLAVGERVNDQVDWENVTEEIDLAATLDGQQPVPVPQTCPLTLEETIGGA